MNVNKLTVALFFFCHSLLVSQSKVGCIWTNLNCPVEPYSGFYDDAKDELYFAGLGAVYKLNKSDNSWIKLGSVADSSIWANAAIVTIYKDNKNVFYAGCKESTHSWISTPGGRSWKRITDPLFMSSDSLTHLRVTAIYQTANGSVYFGTNSGLYVTTDNNISYKKVTTPFTYVTYLTGDKSGNLFVGTAGGLYLTKDNCKSWVRMQTKWPGDNVNSIAFDPKGIIYITSSNDLARSTDGGDTWVSLKSQITTDVQFMPKYIAVDNRGDIIFEWNGLNYSTDSGDTWKILNFVSSELYPDGKTYKNIEPTVIFFDLKNDLYVINGYGYYDPSAVFKGVVALTDIKGSDNTSLPEKLLLKQNFPNPFNPSTTIQYSIPARETTRSGGCRIVSDERSEGGISTLKVYDILGREVKTLVNEEKTPGNYEVKFYGTGFSSGVYFYTLRTGDFVQTKKMIIMK